MSKQQAVDLYTSFREAKPTKLARLKVDIPRVVACMGHTEAIDYRTTHAGKVTLYRHKFAKGSRPLLCVSGDGKQLMLLGGRYEWTDRGIQDEDASGQLIDNPKHGATINPRANCPICGKPGGSHAAEALAQLGIVGEYAHPRCLAKSFGVSRKNAPARAHLYKGHYYFETHDDARSYALQHGYPTDRIIAYSRGWAIQGGVSGDYAGPHGLKVGNWRHSRGWRVKPSWKTAMKRNPIEKIAGGGFVATGEAIPYVQLAAVKGALKLESLGMKMRGGSLRKRWAVHLGLKPSTKYPELIAHIEKLMRDMLPKGNPKTPADFNITQKDLDAAARGLRMVGMSVQALQELAESQNLDVFAGRVIYMAAKQMAAAKRRMGASLTD